MIYSLYEYSESGDKYNFSTSLNQTDFIDSGYSFVGQDSENVSSFSATLKGATDNKGLPRYDNLFASNENELDNLNPLILTKQTVEGDVIWFTFITTRIKITDRENFYYTLEGVGFKYFYDFKLLNANTNYPEGSYDPEELPDDLGKYQANATLKQHLDYAFESFLNPKELTYGRLGTNQAPERKFKGLENIVVNYADTTQKSIQSDIRSISTFIKELFESFEVTLETKQYFDRQTGKVNIVVEERKELDVDVIRNNDDIIKNEVGNTLRTNYIFGYANPNIDTNQARLVNYDFTSLELSEDVSFVSEDNQTYAENTTKTLLTEANKNKFVREVQVTPSTAFIEINAGDIASINTNVFLIKSITENNSVNGLEYFVEIKEII